MSNALFPSLAFAWASVVTLWWMSGAGCCPRSWFGDRWLDEAGTGTVWSMPGALSCFEMQWPAQSRMKAHLFGVRAAEQFANPKSSHYQCLHTRLDQPELSRSGHSEAWRLCCRGWLCWQTMACLAVFQSLGCPLAPSNESIGVAFCSPLMRWLGNLTLEADYRHRCGSALAMKLAHKLSPFLIAVRQRRGFMCMLRLLIHQAKSYSFALSPRFIVWPLRYGLSLEFTTA